MPDTPILVLDNVVKHFPVRAGVLRRSSEVVHAVDGVSFEVIAGETLGIVGETGSGKSTLARCIAALHPLTSGHISFSGKDVADMDRRSTRAFRRNVQMIFQDPYGSLNPRRRVGPIIGDPLAVHNVASGAQRRRMVMDLMERVGLNPEDLEGLTYVDTIVRPAKNQHANEVKVRFLTLKRAMANRNSDGRPVGE